MRHRGMFAAALLMLPHVAQAKVKLPYFDSIKENDLCGGLPDYCQPTASKKWFRVGDPFDYSGDPNTILGSKIETIYDPYKCTAPLVSPADFNNSPVITVNGTVKEISKPGLSAAISADLDALAEQVGVSLPDTLKVKLKAALGTDITQKLNQSVTIKYQRIQMSVPFKQANMPACLAIAKTNEKVITGISVITVSADWSKDRFSEALNAIELEASFSSLSADARAVYDANKNKVLSGKMPETSFVIMASFEWGKAPKD